MEKIRDYRTDGGKKSHCQAMRRFLRFSVACIALVGMSFAAQAQKVERFSVNNVTLKEAIQQLEKQVDVGFFYQAKELEEVKGVSLVMEGVDVLEILRKLLESRGFVFEQLEGNIIIKKVPQKAKMDTERWIVKGQVIDAGKQPLPGVSVVLKGTTIGVATDVNGEFALMVPEDAVLVFSFVGMETQELKAVSGSPMLVVMAENVKEISEVVVTGYQTIAKERATGAYSIVDEKALEQKPVSNLSQALTGLVPGLVVESAPVDGKVRFSIRGRGTLQQVQLEENSPNFKTDNDPLIVVDGFPISGYTTSNDPFSTINPNDVESVTVLKDAAATSIYGARAANGVIVITTKKGKAGDKLDITADAYWSVSSRVDLDYLYNMASAESQFRFEELMNKYEPIHLMGGSDPYTEPSAQRRYMSAPYSLLFERDGKKNITAAEYDAQKQELIERANRGVWKDDMRDYVFRRMMRQQYNVALRGATDRLNYALSGSFDDEKSYLQGNRDQRVLLNLSSTAQLTKNLSFDLTVNTMFEKEWNEGISVADTKTWLSPWTQLVDENGEYVHVPTSETIYEPIWLSEYEGKTPASWRYNPVEDREHRSNLTKVTNYRVQGGFHYDTSWGLSLSAEGQYEQRRYDRHISYDPESFLVRDYYNTYSKLNDATEQYVSYFPTGGIFSDEGHTYESYNVRGQADYNATFGKHALTVLAGTEVISSTTERHPIVTRYGFNEYTNSVLTSLDYVTQDFDIFGNYTRLPFEELGSLSTQEDRYFSVYANAAYTYDDRYSVTASFRTDASNYQSESQRDKFSPFWSVGASWLVSQEKFMDGADWLDMLKLRATYGIAGIAAGKSGTSSVTTLETHPGDLIFSNNESYNTIASRGNPSLTWEKSRTVNLGLDFALFEHKLSGSVDFYNRYSYDVLSMTSVPAISYGTTSMTLNNGAILNRGVELSVSADLPVAGDLRWNGTVNYSYNHNELKEYNYTGAYMAISPGYVVGRPIGFATCLKPVGYTPEGFVLLQGKDGTQQAITDLETSHYMDFVYPSQGESFEDNNWVYALGSQTPTSNLSFMNQFTWKDLTFSFMITGRFGYYVNTMDVLDATANQPSYSKQLDKSFKVYDEGYANQSSYSVIPLYTDESYDTYRAGGGYMYMMGVASFFRNNYIRGDHIRLNEVYLGYDLPESLLEKQGVFSRINVYAQASNLGLIWSANGEMDPEYTIGSVKPMPMFTFGLRLGFKNWK